MSKVQTFFLPFQSGVLSFYEDLQCLKYVNPFISIFVFYSNYPPKFFYNSTSFIPFEIIDLRSNVAFISYEAVKKSNYGPRFVKSPNLEVNFRETMTL